MVSMLPETSTSTGHAVSPIAAPGRVMRAPPACTLAAADQPHRIEVWASILDHATASHPIDDGIEFAFPPGPAFVELLNGAIASELACCSFFSFDLTTAATATTMTVRAPGHDREVVTDLFGSA